MVTISITRDHGRIAAVNARGHALTGQSGSDIVCAAVSAVLQTALIGLTDYAELKVGSEMSDGFMHVVLPREMSETQSQKAETILETMLKGLQSIEQGNKRAVRVREV